MPKASEIDGSLGTAQESGDLAKVTKDRFLYGKVLGLYAWVYLQGLMRRDSPHPLFPRELEWMRDKTKPSWLLESAWSTRIHLAKGMNSWEVSFILFHPLNWRWKSRTPVNPWTFRDSSRIAQEGFNLTVRLNQGLLGDGTLWCASRKGASIPTASTTSCGTVTARTRFFMNLQRLHLNPPQVSQSYGC